MNVPTTTTTEPTATTTQIPPQPIPTVVRGFLIEIGKSVFPVYGDAKVGWSIDRDDILEETPYRYATLDEIVFVLVNFSLHIDGDA